MRKHPITFPFFKLETYVASYIATIIILSIKYYSNMKPVGNAQTYANIIKIESSKHKSIVSEIIVSIKVVKQVLAKI